MNAVNPVHALGNLDEDLEGNPEEEERELDGLDRDEYMANLPSLPSHG